MKRLLALCLLAVLLWTPKTHAELASEVEMERVCQNWLLVIVHEKGVWAGSTTPQIAGVREIVGRDGTVLGRCYSIAPRGYIVVPVLKELPPVKSYSEDYELDIGQPGGFPVMLRETLERRAAMFVQTYGSLQASQPVSGDVLYGWRHRAEWDRLAAEPALFTKGLDAQRFDAMVGAGPLLTTSWSQNSPYNNRCPMGDGGQCVVGCVATAAAQIMKYHEWPPSGTGYHSYPWDGDQSCNGDVGGGTLSVFFSDPYDWANMPDNCNTGCSATEEDALAELSQEVGIAFEMDYGHCSSGANTEDALTVFPTYFRYKPSIDQEYRKSHTASSWFTLIQNEVNGGRPMLYRIRGQDAGDPEEGHAFVCDGWQVFSSLDQYHMNYGWGGPFTDWYTLDDYFCPWDTCFQDDEFVIRAIEPREPTIWNVNPSGTGDAPTIQAAINSAADGDEVVLADGTYTGDGNRDIDFSGKAIIVRSGSGHPQSCLVDCGENEHRGFLFDSGEGPESIVEGVAILNGSVGGGWGGGILCQGASPTIVNCIFRNNDAWFGGGAVACVGGASPTFNNCIFEDNDAGSDYTGIPDPQGGAMLVYYGDSVLVTECTFWRNTSLNGGAIAVYGSLVIQECTFVGNSAVENTIGGGLASSIMVWEGSVELSSSVVAFGVGTDDGAIQCNTGWGSIVISCCDVYGNSDGDWVGCIADQVGVDGNFSSNPRFCDGENGDFTVAANSDCLPDNNSCAVLIGAYDQGCGETQTGIADDHAAKATTLSAISYPNPFNPSTTISFTLPERTTVTLAIYDVGGRLVKTLVDETVGEGYQERTWDGRDAGGSQVGSGVYFYRLTAGDKTLTRKMVLIR